jgi:hypothetical protein
MCDYIYASDLLSIIAEPVNNNKTVLSCHTGKNSDAIIVFSRDEQLC